MEAKFKLSPPWTTYYRQLQALFGKDPEIKLFFDENEGAVKLAVNNRCKMNALQWLLPEEVSFGNVVVKILVGGPEGELADNGKTLWEDAFEGNSAVADIEVVEVPFSSRPIVYIGFVREVVQFFNDDLSDPNGNCSTLYQEIAKEIFEDRPSSPDVYFYTVAYNSYKNKALPVDNKIGACFNGCPVKGTLAEVFEEMLINDVAKQLGRGAEWGQQPT